METADAICNKSAHPTLSLFLLIGLRRLRAIVRPLLAPCLISGSNRIDPLKIH